MSITPEQMAVAASTVLYRYCRAIDNHDAHALAQVFSDDVVLVVGGGGAGAEQSFSGRDTVVSLLASLFAQRRWARHSVSNVLVEPDGDDLRVSSYFQFVMGTEAGTVSGIGDYRATMRRAADGLVITRFWASILEETSVAR